MGFLLAVLAGAAAGYLAGSLFGKSGAPGGGSLAETGVVDNTEAPEAVDGEGAAVPDGEASDENPYAGFRVGAFDLIDRDGRPVDESLFDGGVTVLTFFFTSCNGPCPAIARVMNDIQGRTAGSDLRLASISVDGGRDTPAVISSFAESYGADPERWRFLTGDPEAVRELVRESIGFELREQAEIQVADPTGAMMNNILHPTRLLLVGPDRRLIGVYAFNDAEAVDELVADGLAALD